MSELEIYALRKNRRFFFTSGNENFSINIDIGIESEIFAYGKYGEISF
ncbi:hypothetical protein [Okeania sp. KiyG1]|nr:hypothetical protein [Okeania sp. KiyG1]